MSSKRKREIAAENLRLRLAARRTENDEQLEAIEFRLRQLLAEVTADLAGQASCADSGNVTLHPNERFFYER